MVSGFQLLQSVSIRIVGRWLERTHGEVTLTHTRESFGGRGVDLIYPRGLLARVPVKVKSDPYFGSDPLAVADRTLPFYRSNQSAYAFEAVANAATRELGWIFESDAEELYYYFIAIAQSEAEVAELALEPDHILFSELQVDADELVIMQMSNVRGWFEANHERYAPRPVASGANSAWVRVVPRHDLDSAVTGNRSVGGIFQSARF